MLVDCDGWLVVVEFVVVYVDDDLLCVICICDEFEWWIVLFVVFVL